MYQVPFAGVRRKPVYESWLSAASIRRPRDTILAGRADLCALARAHLLDLHLALRAAAAYAEPLQSWPRPYLAVRPRPAVDS
jgi:anthraniloyl-CoA monooxygenase